MLTVQYNGPALVINHAVWYPGESRQATAKQLAAWQAEHGDVFVVVDGTVTPDAEPDAEIVKVPKGTQVRSK
jgi:hypothetical protein